MKKIGILTYHDTTNYGAVLQAFALQKKIEKLGYKSEIIDYKCEAITERYKIVPFYKSKNIKQLIKRILTNKHKRKLKKDFDDFNNIFQKISASSYTKNDIKKTETKYDMIITGSDQVWNLELSGNDTTYMLDYIKNKKKKGTYAVSFGYEIVPERYRNITKEYISKFDNILVREEQGKQIIEHEIKKQAKVVLDPTLLFNKEEWYNLFNIKQAKENKYILLYIIAPNKNIIQFAKKLARKEKCKIIYINDTYKWQFGMKNVWHCTPNKFLEFINGAEYIVTTSFHGVAFSVNFEKQFYYALSNESNNFNSRIESLVKMLNINNREINRIKNLDEKIKYKNINKKLNTERKSSIQLLKQELNNSYKIN